MSPGARLLNNSGILTSQEYDDFFFQRVAAILSLKPILVTASNILWICFHYSTSHIFVVPSNKPLAVNKVICVSSEI